MKLKRQIIVSASAAILLAFPTLARETFNPKLAETATTRHPMAQAHSERLNDAARSTDIIGMTVNNYQNEKLGIVEDLVVDVESGRIVQVILSNGESPGKLNALAAVPPGALRHDADDNVLQLDVGQAMLKAALKFDTAKWDADTQSNRVTEVHGY